MKHGYNIKKKKDSVKYLENHITFPKLSMVLKVVKTNVSPWTTVTFTPKFTNLLYIHSLPSPFAHSFCHYLCAWLVNHRIRDWHLSPSIHHFPICLQHSASLIYQVSFHSTPTATLSVTEHGLVLLFLFFFTYFPSGKTNEATLQQELNIKRRKAVIRA